MSRKKPDLLTQQARLRRKHREKGQVLAIFCKPMRESLTSVLPITAIMFLISLVMLVINFKIVGTPLNGSLAVILAGTLLFILSYQSISVLIVSLLSNLGKLFPVFFYRDRKLSERLALSIGMFTRGEVGAGIIVIAMGYQLGGPALIISILR